MGNNFTVTVPAYSATAIVIPTSGCTPTSITPYIQVNSGSWVEESSATVASGSTVNLGPQPTSGGSWSWTGPNGYTSTSRQINAIPLSSGANAYVATYTNSSGCKSTETFTIPVSGGTTLTPNGTYIITAVNSGLAIDDPDSSTTDGEDIDIWTVNDGANQRPANGQTNQQWNVISVSSGIYELTSVNSGLVLDVIGGGTTNGTGGGDQYTYNGNTWQQWKFTSY